MGTQKRVLKDSSRFNGENDRENAKKRIKSDPPEEVEAETQNFQFDEEYFRMNPRPTAIRNESVEPVDSEKFKPHSESLSSRTPRRRTCPICKDIVPQKEMKLVSVEVHKFILAAIVPHRFASTQNIEKFVQTKSPVVCFSHILESCTKIEEHIKDPKAVEKMLMPKIESVNPNITTTRAECILTQFLFRNRKKYVKPTIDARNFRCVLCKNLRPREKMSRFSSINAKTAVMVGCLLRKTHTVQQAKEYINTGKEQPICMKHTKKGIKEIFDHLKIEKVQQLSTCDSMNQLMVTVNSLLPGMTTSQFEDALKKLVITIEPSRKRESLSSGEAVRCSVCKFQGTRSGMCMVKSTSLKASILAVFVRKGRLTLEEAQKMLTLEKAHPICHGHFEKVLKRINKLLGIANVRQIDDCAENLMTELMGTMNTLLPNLRIAQFKDSVHEIAKKAEKFKKQNTMNSELTKATRDIDEEIEPIREDESSTTCGICQLRHPKEKFFEVNSKRLKMLLMLGCVLRESHTLQEALSFIKSEKEVPSCRKHFRKSLQKILDFLKIESPVDVSRSSDKTKKSLMEIVSTLLPEMTITQFEKSVLKLAKQVEKFNEHRNLFAKQ